MSDESKVEVTLETGETFSGENYEELAGKLKTAREHAGKTVTELKAERDVLLQQVAVFEANKSRPPEEIVPSDSVVKNYYDGWGSQDMGKIVEANLEVTAIGLGYKNAAEFREVHKVQREVTEQVRGRMAIAEFSGRVGERYQDTTENTSLMTQRLREQGRPLTADNLEITFNELLRDGKLTAAEAPAGGNNKAKAPPATPSAGSTPTDTGVPTEADLLSMSPEKFDEYRKKSGMKPMYHD